MEYFTAQIHDETGKRIRRRMKKEGIKTKKQFLFWMLEQVGEGITTIKELSRE